MLNKNQKLINSTQQYGFTMVELMVAVVLALLLALVAGQSYLSTKTTYSATEQSARIQENLRFATHFLKKEIRQGGNIGCFQTINSHLLNDNNNRVEETVEALYDLSQPINVWRYSRGNAGNGLTDYDLSENQAYQTPQDNAGRWRDWKPREVNNADGNRRRPTRRALDGQVMNGSDIILVSKISEPLGIRLNDNTLNNNELSVATFNNNTVQQGQVMLVGNCNVADLFVHTDNQVGGNTGGGQLVRGDGTNLEVTNRTADSTVWSQNWGPDAEVRFVESTLYFIGEGSSGLPALFRLDLGAGVGTDTTPNQPIEIVDGIENMRALVGVDTNNSGTFNSYQIIDAIPASNADINDVRSLQIGLLATGDRNSNIPDANKVRYQLTQRHTVLTPDNDVNNAAVLDTRYRQATTNTVQLRNAGLRRPPEFND